MKRTLKTTKRDIVDAGYDPKPIEVMNVLAYYANPTSSMYDDLTAWEGAMVDTVEAMASLSPATLRRIARND